MSEHSKLPYIVEEAYTDNGMVSHYNIIDKHGLRVAQSEHKCHAQLIVDSVNKVKRLEEALQDIRDFAESIEAGRCKYTAEQMVTKLLYKTQHALKADNQ